MIGIKSYFKYSSQLLIIISVVLLAVSLICDKTQYMSCYPEVDTLLPSGLTIFSFSTVLTGWFLADSEKRRHGVRVTDLIQVVVGPDLIKLSLINYFLLLPEIILTYIFKCYTTFFTCLCSIVIWTIYSFFLIYNVNTWKYLKKVALYQAIDYFTLSPKKYNNSFLRWREHINSIRLLLSDIIKYTDKNDVSELIELENITTDVFNNIQNKSAKTDYIRNTNIAFVFGGSIGKWFSEMHPNLNLSKQFFADIFYSILNHKSTRFDSKTSFAEISFCQGIISSIIEQNSSEDSYAIISYCMNTIRKTGKTESLYFTLWGWFIVYNCYYGYISEENERNYYCKASINYLSHNVTRLMTTLDSAWKIIILHYDPIMQHQLVECLKDNLDTTVYFRRYLT